MSNRAAVLAYSLVIAALGCSEGKEICNDGRDNDHNGATDCADSGCGIGAACDAFGKTCGADKTCSVCSGNGGTAQAAEETCGDGFDNDCDGLIDCDDPDCQPRESSPGRTCDALQHTCGAPDATGHATCGAGGVTPGGTTRIGQIRFLGSDFYVLGTAGSGYQEQATLTFEVRAADGTPYPGLQLAFSHDSQGGSFLGVQASCGSTPPFPCTAVAVTDAQGQAQVLLTSGRRYASLAVRAEATAQGETRSITAGGITVVGAKPNGAHLSLDCEIHNIPALTHHDCLYSNYCKTLGTVPCSVKLADRFGTIVGVPTAVSFRAEAGAVPAMTVSPAFDVSKPADQQPGLGHADAFFEACNSPLPFDVAPLPGEFSVAADFGCGMRTGNPRDGLVTLIAMVQGEEGFVDLDLNGQYDEGEPFVDLPEPFVDIDDDGVWEPGEWFLDVDGDGQWSPPNGRWDADTVLWTQTRMLYTGYPERAAFAGSELFSRFFVQGSPPAPTPIAPDFLVHKGPPATTASYGVFFTDQNLNPLTSIATYQASAAVDNVKVALSGPAPTVDSIGTSFRQLYCDQPAFEAATCRPGPADAACRAPRCFVVWDVGFCATGTCAFIYGSTGVVSITGKEVGRDVAQVSATIDDVTATFSVGGECVP